MKRRLLIMAAGAFASTAAYGQGAGKPIIDMHMHAWSLSEFGGESVPGCIGQGCRHARHRSGEAIRFYRPADLQGDGQVTSNRRRHHD
jgi:hypothetical protein